MKRLTSLSAALLLAVLAVRSAQADTYNVDKSHSGAEFKVKHMFSKVNGKFTDFSGTINWDKADLAKSSVVFTLKSASIDTASEKRDAHLRTAEFFGAEKCPDITFKSSKIAATAKDTFAVSGTLNMHCIDKEITLPVKFLGEGKDPWGGTTAGFETTIVLNRKDFQMNWNKSLDDGGFLLADDVEVSISLETKKEAPAAAPAK
jgi:polyisoprenoid-binding protein YceI